MIFLSYNRPASLPEKALNMRLKLSTVSKYPKAKLVYQSFCGDEGLAYEERIRSYAEIMNVPLIIRPDIIGTERGTTPDGKKLYTLWIFTPTRISLPTLLCTKDLAMPFSKRSISKSL